MPGRWARWHGLQLPTGRVRLWAVHSGAPGAGADQAQVVSAASTFTTPEATPSRFVRAAREEEESQ
jgi:hypothetical protein